MRANTWLSPKSWKWLIRQVLTNSRTQPNQKTALIDATAVGLCTVQMTGSGIGRHCQ